MKQSVYTSGEIVNSDDLDFEARSKNYSIEQTRYDLLKQQTTLAKGVIKDSGMTAGHTGDPLKVYITSGTTVNIYSGVAYDGFEGRSNRIWVPDLPSDVPATEALANSNHDNIDMVDETIENEFTTTSRPRRTSIKEFSAADASGDWYVCIRHDAGTYDPITIPNDGSVVDSKSYDSYLVRVSQFTALQLHALDGLPWLQLGTLDWDGADLTLLSDDRLGMFASCTVTVEDDLIVQHQTRFHENCIISTDSSKLACSIDGTHTKIVVSYPTAFASSEGILVNGEFIQTLNTPLEVQFGPTMAASTYYIYINSAGTALATTVYTTARSGCILCDVYWTGVQLQLASLRVIFSVVDRRRFGSIGIYQMQSVVLGTGYSELNDLKIKEMSDELKTHRYNLHGNGLYVTVAHNTTPTGAISLSPTIGGSKLSVAGLQGGDYLYFGSWECYTLSGNNFVEFFGEPAGDYVVYAARDALASDSRHSYYLGRATYAISAFWDGWYPIAAVNYNGAGSLTGPSPLLDPLPKDLRVFGTVGYYDIQKNNNALNRNTLPQLMTCLYGVSPSLGAGVTSSPIYLADDWGPTNYGGGGTVSGQQVFIVKPQIHVYELDAGFYYERANSEIIHITETSFEVRNVGGIAHVFYWIAIGPSYANEDSSVLKNAHNPTYQW